jgi:hypothetical protein
MQSRWGGKFWAVDDAAANFIGSVSISALIIWRPPYPICSLNSAPLHPPEPRLQASTSNDSPEGALAA